MILPMLWDFGFLKQRPAYMGNADLSTVMVIVGVGLSALVWFRELDGVNVSRMGILTSLTLPF